MGVKVPHAPCRYAQGPKSIYPVYLDVWMRIIVCVTIHNTGYSICMCGLPPPQEIFRSSATIVPTLRWVVCSLKRKIPVLPKALACSGGITAHCVCMCVCARVTRCMCVWVHAETKKATNVPPAKTKLIPKCVYVCVRASIPKASSQNVLPNNLVPKCVCV